MLNILVPPVQGSYILRKESISENVIGQIFNKSFKNFFFYNFKIFRPEWHKKKRNRAN